MPAFARTSAAPLARPFARTRVAPPPLRAARLRYAVQAAHTASLARSARRPPRPPRPGRSSAPSRRSPVPRRLSGPRRARRGQAAHAASLVRSAPRPPRPPRSSRSYRVARPIRAAPAAPRPFVRPSRRSPVPRRSPKPRVGSCRVSSAPRLFTPCRSLTSRGRNRRPSLLGCPRGGAKLGWDRGRARRRPQAKYRFSHPEAPEPHLRRYPETNTTRHGATLPRNPIHGKRRPSVLSRSEPFASAVGSTHPVRASRSSDLPPVQQIPTPINPRRRGHFVRSGGPVRRCDEEISRGFYRPGL
ncbi:hypothetical protein BKA14_000231 [Actinoplanes abujensis]|uniref:Uncharacterized protein n=1 Tax=Paractinoplanes abujensis TaxID=882441 RepID=A0A7W7FXL9_9ACTN|nr:hypothetical protein [Actinoplanes abujensis]